MKRIAKELLKIARNLDKRFDQTDEKQRAQAIQIVTEYSRDINDIITNFNNKNKILAEKLDKQIKELQKAIYDNSQNAEELQVTLQKLYKKWQKKNFYQQTKKVPALNIKNYDEKNSDFLQGIMTEGKVKQAFNCLARYVANSLDYSKILDKYEKDLMKFQDGSYVRAIIGKQSSHRKNVNVFRVAAKGRARMVSYCKELEDYTRNIMVDLVDIQGKIIAHTSVTAKSIRDCRERFELEPQDYTKDPVKNSSIKTAGISDFFSGVFEKISEVAKKTFDKLVSFASKIKFVQKKQEETQDKITEELDEFISLIQG